MTARLALSVVVAIAGVATVTVKHRHHHSPTLAAASALPSASDALAERVSRSRERTPLTPPVPPKPRRRQRPHLHLVGETLSVTAYCATGNRTASGEWPRIGMAAGNRWPLGTNLHVVGYGDVVVEDRIGWGSDLDLFFGDDPGCEQRALNFGRHHLQVVTSR